MARWTAVLGMVGLLAFGLAGAAAEETKPAGRLVVHEWGTFTSVQGADGVGLEGLQAEEEALPAFVYSRAKVRDCPLRKQGYKGLEVPANHVTQKMETPVLYFHTDAPRTARVRVDFVKGLISQWYPVTDLLGPPEGACGDAPLDVSKVERSFLQWDVELLPRADKPDGIPAVPDDDPWAFARKVDAAYVRTLPRTSVARLGPVESEHFLFYRGLGSFRLPFSVGADAKGALSFRNESEEPVAHVVALEVTEGGAQGRYDVHTGLAAGSTTADLLGTRPLEPWKLRVEGLKLDLQKILVGQGMNPDEAWAMVATWTRSWFLSEGTRVLYVVPRPLVDALLPLAIDPAPDDLRRVLVGRIEVITPATQAEVERALADLAGGTEDEARIRAAQARLDRLGRFLEPHLRRVIETTKDKAVNRFARELLGEAPRDGC